MILSSFRGNMGRKGVSKRKSSKEKSETVSKGSGTGAISSITRVTETPLPHPAEKSETKSTGKKGKKK
jgi:hypothetical protein